MYYFETVEHDPDLHCPKPYGIREVPATVGHTVRHGTGSTTYAAHDAKPPQFLRHFWAPAVSSTMLMVAMCQHCTKTKRVNGTPHA